MVSESSQSRNDVSYLDLQIDISNGDLVCSIFNKRDALIFMLSVFLIYLGLLQQPQLMVHTSYS